MNVKRKSLTSNMNRKLGIIAVLAALPFVASAQSNIPVDTWVFYPDNLYVGKAAEAPRAGKSATIAVDTWVFYPENRFSGRAAEAPQAGKSATIALDPWVFYPDNRVSDTASASGRQIGAGVASEADYSGLVKQGFLGSQVQSRPDSTIKISSTTGNIYVDHLKTTKIENDKGQSFVWQFDSIMSMSAFPLKLIAPSGFDAGNTQVSVLHPAHHTAP